MKAKIVSLVDGDFRVTGIVSFEGGKVVGDTARAQRMVADNGELWNPLTKKGVGQDDGGAWLNALCVKYSGSYLRVVPLDFQLRI